MAVNQLARTHGEILPEGSHWQHCDGPHQLQLSPWAARRRPSQIEVKSDSCSGPSGKSNKAAWAVSFIEWVLIKGNECEETNEKNYLVAKPGQKLWPWFLLPLTCCLQLSIQLGNKASRFWEATAPRRNQMAQWHYRAFDQCWFGGSKSSHISWSQFRDGELIWFTWGNCDISERYQGVDQ